MTSGLRAGADSIEVFLDNTFRIGRLIVMIKKIEKPNQIRQRDFGSREERGGAF